MLAIAKEKALESDNLKSTFLANISHEIRTPMNGIVGFVSLLEDETLASDVRSEYIQIIKNSSSQLLHILTQIIDISRIESGNVEIVKSAFSVNEILHETEIYVKELISEEKKHIEFNVSFLPVDKSDIIVQDREHLEQVLFILSDNAVKFTEKGRIDISCKKLNNRTITFRVTNTGKGIDPGLEKLIFDRFRKGIESIVDSPRGMGLGLTIAKGLTELMGGTIKYEPGESGSSVFSCTIPFELHAQTFSGTIHDVNLKKGARLLIVEDVIENFLLMKEYLDEYETKIFYAESGKKALEIIRDNEIELVLMDIRLPDMNGTEVLNKIRMMGHTIPVIAQTAFATSNDKEHFLQEGFSDYIAKPFSKDAFITMLYKHL
ncbi:MAG: response regulator [Bacteroidota bacterium]